jgi:hypothetical protein
MVDNPNIRSDEKNQKNKKAVTEIGRDTPRVGETITLHDPAIALAIVAPGKKGEKISDGKLLRGLKTGEVQAGFHCSTDPLIWISIPKEYWVGIATDAFRRIRYSPRKKNRTGVFPVTIKDFPKQYIAACIQFAADTGLRLSSEWVIQAFGGAMARIESTFEVEIPKDNWDQYLSKQEAMKPLGGVESASTAKSGSGREAHSGWKKLNANLAAYLVANNINSEEETEIKTIAATVYALVEKEAEKTKLPKLSSFEKEVSHVFELVRRCHVK